MRLGEVTILEYDLRGNTKVYLYIGAGLSFTGAFVLFLIYWFASLRGSI
jgi:hypothetical protein